VPQKGVDKDDATGAFEPATIATIEA
jgi:hypothetical protein